MANREDIFWECDEITSLYHFMATLEKEGRITTDTWNLFSKKILDTQSELNSLHHNQWIQTCLNPVNTPRIESSLKPLPHETITFLIQNKKDLLEFLLELFLVDKNQWLGGNPHLTSRLCFFINRTHAETRNKKDDDGKIPTLKELIVDRLNIAADDRGVSNLRWTRDATSTQILTTVHLHAALANAPLPPPSVFSTKDDNLSAAEAEEKARKIENLISEATTYQLSHGCEPKVRNPDEIDNPPSYTVIHFIYYCYILFSAYIMMSSWESKTKKTISDATKSNLKAKENPSWPPPHERKEETSDNMATLTQQELNQHDEEEEEEKETETPAAALNEGPLPKHDEGPLPQPNSQETIDPSSSGDESGEESPPHNPYSTYSTSPTQNFPNERIYDTTVVCAS